jgi:hypothetical protein
MLKPDPHASPRKGRHFLRAAVVPKTTIQVGEPVRVQGRLRAGAPEQVTARIAGAIGLDRYVSFDSPGSHKVPLIIAHPDGRQDRTEVEFEVVENLGIHPYPILTMRQEPSNPFMLHVSVKNVDAVHRPGVRYEWEIAGHGAYILERPFFVLDCERLINPKDLLIPFDLLFTVIYPDGERRTAKESFRVFNDYAWFKSRGVLKPRLSYDYRARGAGLHLAASCVIINDDDEYIEITGRQIEILYDDADRVIVPCPLEPMDAVLPPRSQREFDCALLRRKLPQATLGYAVHFHGRTRSGLKVEASAYFEHYSYQTKRWSDVTSLHAVDLLNEVKAALAESAASPRPPTPRVALSANGSRIRETMERSEAELHAVPAAVPAALAPFAQQTTPGLTLTAVRNYVEAMRPMWTPSEAAKRDKGLYAIVGAGQTLYDQGNDETFFLGKQCLLDEGPPTDDLFCKSSGKSGQVFVPARIMNGKKGDVVLLPGGPIGIIGKLLLALNPPQFFSHCGIMTGNFYKVRHATASEEWVEDQVIGKIFDSDRGTQGFDPEGLKYIWPGTVDQTVDQAFHGSYFVYETRDGKHKKPYKIEAFSNDPVFFMEHDRHVVFPLVLKPDPLLEGDPEFAHVRPTLHKVAEKAKQINGHYRFFCYSNGAISLKDDTAHLAPDQGPTWWASGTRPMVCSSLVLAAVDDVTDVKIHMEGEGTFTTEQDLEKTPSATLPGAKAPDEDALVDPLTRDGMYFYTAQERLQAAEALYSKMYEKVLGKSGDVGRFLTDAPDDAANQICNTFAFDYSGREFDDEDAKDSEKWRNPGDGRAVSPDDMLTFWDPPTPSKDSVHGLYGSAHRMVFRDGLLEEREIGVWVIREKIGKLIVTVSHQGNPIAGADVKVGGQVVVTNGSGVAVVDLPEGAYTVEAGVLMNGLFFEGRAPAHVTDRGSTSVTVVLNDPPEFNRIVVIGGNIEIKDEENFGSDEILHGTFGVTPVRLGPLNRQQSVPYVRKWGGEIRVEVRFDLTWNADLSVTVVSNVKLFEGTSEDTNDLDGEGGDIVTVGKDASNVPMHVYVRNDDEDDDDHVILDILISNFVDL